MRAIVIHAPKDLRIEEREADPVGIGQVEIAIEAGGICGSDLHYYNHGGFGSVRLRQPMVLGHEVAGRIVGLGEGARGEGVDDFHLGDRVAVSPSRPCKTCLYCQQGLQNHCINMRFYGSAMPFPHIQGAFQQILVAERWQCHKVDAGVSIEQAAFAEPFSVALHAVKRAGSLLDKSVLVTGCGTIGALIVMAARFHGAREIIVTDVQDHALGIATKIGADRAINIARDGQYLEQYATGKGMIDVHFEASGNAQAMTTGLNCLRPRGIMVQVGLGGDVAIAQNLVVSKEIEMRGSFRFHEEFALAVDLMDKGRIDVSPLLSAVLPLEEARQAFELASDKSQSMKVQIHF